MAVFLCVMSCPLILTIPYFSLGPSPSHVLSYGFRLLYFSVSCLAPSSGRCGTPHWVPSPDPVPGAVSGRRPGLSGLHSAAGPGAAGLLQAL